MLLLKLSSINIHSKNMETNYVAKVNISLSWLRVLLMWNVFYYVKPRLLVFVNKQEQLSWQNVYLPYNVNSKSEE